MAQIEMLNPPSLFVPRTAYSQLSRARASEFVFIAGQVGVDGQGKLAGKDDFEAQCLQVFSNIEAALVAVGVSWSNVVQFTTFFTRRQDIGPFRNIRAREFPRMFKDGRYPPNTSVIVAGLADPEHLLEIQAIAAS
jgi:enamine deaminase RidA (YjgF/YER057c/UK114 family)